MVRAIKEKQREKERDRTGNLVFFRAHKKKMPLLLHMPSTLRAGPCKTGIEELRKWMKEELVNEKGFEFLTDTCCELVTPFKSSLTLEAELRSKFP